MLSKYKHDCYNCKFLGTFEEYDLYFCDIIKDLPTVIARFGSEPPNYISGISLIYHYPELMEAYNRAIEKGYLKK